MQQNAFANAFMFKNRYIESSYIDINARNHLARQGSKWGHFLKN